MKNGKTTKTKQAKAYVTDRMGSVLNSAPAGAKAMYGSFGEVSASVSMAKAGDPVMLGFAGYMYEPESVTYRH